MFNFEEYRIKDLKEFHQSSKFEKNEFRYTDFVYSYFIVGKNCKLVICFDQQRNQVRIELRNKFMAEKRYYGGANVIPFEAIDVNAIAENFLVFNYLVTDTSFFKRKQIDPIKTHLVLTNIDFLLAGQIAPREVKNIITEEEYKNAMTIAKNECEKEQELVYQHQLLHE